MLVSISSPVRSPTPAQIKKARETLKKEQAAKKAALKDREKAKLARIKKLQDTLGTVKKTAVTAVTKIDAQIKKIQDENQAVVLKLKNLEQRKQVVINRFNDRMASLRKRLSALTNPNRKVLTK
jgi:chromosome segregation ATPase